MKIIGVIIYHLADDGSLHGEWTTKGDIGIEIAKPKNGKKGLGGTYDVNIFSADNKHIFIGSLDISAVKDRTYRLCWAGKNPLKGKPGNYEGYGLERDGYLAADYWDVEGQKLNPIVAFFKRLFG